MDGTSEATRTAVGLRVRAARAVAVLLGGEPIAPRFLARRDLELHDPDHPDSRHPWRAALGLDGERAESERERLRTLAERAARRALAALLGEQRRSGLQVAGAGILVAAGADPERIGSPAIRARASEARFFRRVLEEAVRAAGLPSLTLVERVAWTDSAALLKRRPEDLKRVVAEMGRSAGRPWAANEKLAALAAWVALAGTREG